MKKKRRVATARPPRRLSARVHPPPPGLKTIREESRNRRECELVSFVWWERNRPPGY